MLSNIDSLDIDDTLCNICGDELCNGYIYKTDCNHIFHYECLMKSFQNNIEKNNVIGFDTGPGMCLIDQCSFYFWKENFYLYIKKDKLF